MTLLTLRTLLLLHLLPLSSAHNPNNVQAPLHNHQQWTGCLPGPLQQPTHPACTTAHDNDTSTKPTHDQPISDDPPQDATDFAPWTHQPYCSPDPDSPYCVFTNAHYPSEGKGVSIIANPADPKTESSLSGLVALFQSSINTSDTTTKLATKAEDPPYKATPLPGRGIGLIATRKIPQGEILMIDHAALLADSAFPSKVKREVGRELLERGIRRLEKERRDEVLGLAVSDEGVANGGTGAASKEVNVEDVVKTNSFTLEVGGGSYMALFPKIARINHACSPNAFTRFDEETLSNKVMAFRDINKGEEITISYSEFGLTHPERQRILQLKWGFKCTCSLCTAPPSEITTSDARRLKIKALGPQVIQQVQASNFRLAIELNKEMVDLIVQEKMIPHLGEHHEVMARLNMAAGYRKDAKRYAKLAIEELERYALGWGRETEESVTELKELVGKL